MSQVLSDCVLGSISLNEMDLFSRLINLQTLLNNSRENTNWEIVDERRKFLHQVYPSIRRSCYGKLLPPNCVQDVFHSKDIEHLAIDYIKFVDKDREYIKKLEWFFNFLDYSGYKDEPKLDEDAKPSSHRTTPVHHAAKISDINKIIPLFKIYNRYDVNYTDESGLSHFHVACRYALDNEIEKFLRSGHDPNSANDDGSTPLHEIYKGLHFFDHIKKLVDLFFKICDEVNQSVQVDARDKLGRTPLQMAVANLWPESIDILFERGADLSNFIFPTESYFAERYNKSPIRITVNDRLKLASGALTVVEKIENRGYQLKRSDALTIMKCFTKYGLFEKSTDLENCWYNNEKFIKRAKEIQIRPGLTLDEVVRMRPEEAEKLLTYEDYWNYSADLKMNSYRCGKEFEELTALHLCEKLSRGFFKSWALDPFMELINDRLPYLCCEMIIEQFSNEDLCNICLAAARKSS